MYAFDCILPELPRPCGKCSPCMLGTAKKETETLRDAIKKHRDQKLDDRCWLDDKELYKVLGENTGDQTLPPKNVFLGNCAKYWECRQSDARYIPTTVEQEQQNYINQLETRCKKLEAQVMEFTMDKGGKT